MLISGVLVGAGDTVLDSSVSKSTFIVSLVSLFFK